MSLNLSSLSKIVANAEKTAKFNVPTGAKDLFDPKRPICRYSRCTKKSRCIQLSRIVPAKKGSIRVVSGVTIHDSMATEKRIEVAVTLMDEGTIGFYCEYHEFELSYRRRRDAFETIINSVCVFPINGDYMETLRANSMEDLYWDPKQLILYDKDQRIVPRISLYLEKMPLRHNFSIVWKRQQDLKPVAKGKFVVWENEEYNYERHIIKKIKNLVEVHIDKMATKGEFRGYWGAVMERVSRALADIADELEEGDPQEDAKIYDALKRWGVFDLQ